MERRRVNTSTFDTISSPSDLRITGVRIAVIGHENWRYPVVMPYTNQGIEALTGVMTAPTDVLLSGIDRNSADMMNYLRWEEALGTKFSAG
ncbi:MAG: hypothetical protein IIB14_01185 [Chloroflexi bacterium]|nr:hypothetical protein [Chloroflexota bacterium]